MLNPTIGICAAILYCVTSSPRKWLMIQFFVFHLPFQICTPLRQTIFIDQLQKSEFTMPYKTNNGAKAHVNLHSSFDFISSKAVYCIKYLYPYFRKYLVKLFCAHMKTQCQFLRGFIPLCDCCYARWIHVFVSQWVVK